MNLSGPRPAGWTTLLGALLAVLLAGCTSQKEPDWKTLIGTMTYDQAVLELGPPSKVATLTDGVTVAEWLQYSSRVYSTPGPYFGPWGGLWGSGAGTISTTPNVYLLLTFGPDHKLASHRRLYK